MNGAPARPAIRVRANLGWPVEYAGKRRKRKSVNEYSLALGATDTGRQVGVNVI
jgi:hypothetical protein